MVSMAMWALLLNLELVLSLSRCPTYSLFSPDISFSVQLLKSRQQPSGTRICSWFLPTKFFLSTVTPYCSWDLVIITNGFEMMLVI